MFIPNLGVLRRLLLLSLCALCVSVAAGQATGSVRGHVTNAAGVPVTSGTVRLTLDQTTGNHPRTYVFSFPIDGYGNYSGTGIEPANYLGVVCTPDGTTLDFAAVSLTAGQTITVDFDMSRQSYIDAMSPQDRKDLDAYKARNAATISANQQIANLNNLLVQGRTATRNGQFAEAVASLQTAVQLGPDQPILWDALGDAQLGMADAAALQAKNAGRAPASLPSVVQLYQNAADSYQKALEITSRGAPQPAITGTVWNQIGQIDGKMGHIQEAAHAYESAAAANPTQTSLYLFNEAATLYNNGDFDNAATAAARTIIADPSKANAYYIKAQSLIQKATVNPTTSKVEAPPGCVDAYQTYLELAPNGPHASEVQDILKGLGASTSRTASARPSNPAPTSAYSAPPPPYSPPTYTAPAPPSPSSYTPAPQVAATVPPAPRRAIVPEPQPAPQPAPIASIPIPHNYALIFATDNYAHWPHLDNPISDADALNDALTSLYGFHVEELKNPTGEQILQKLTEYLHRHFEMQDQLMIVFSGHGYFDEDLGQGFLAPADALPIQDDLGHRTLLAHQTLMAYVNRIPSTHVILVLDACFAGTLDRKIADSSMRGNPTDVYVHATLPELLVRKQSKRTRRYFASGGKDFVPDGLPGHHSPFISALLVTLNQAADTKGFVTLDDLQEGLDTVNPEPRWGDIQGDNDPGADFLLLTPDAVRKLSAN